MIGNIHQNDIGYLIDQLPEATAFFDEKLRLVYASHAWAHDFDFDKHSVFGKTIYQLFGKGRKNWGKAVNESLSGNTARIVQRHFDQTQDEKWFEWHFKPWYDAHENIMGIIANTIDVTEQIAQEHEFDKIRLLLAQQSELANIGTWNYSAVNDELSWCETTSKIHEVPDDFMVVPDSAIHFFKQGHDRNTIARVLDSAMKSGDPWSEKLQIITHKGNEKWVISSGKAIFKNGKFVGLIGTCQDIDKEVKEQSKSIEKEKLLRTLIDHLPQHIFIKDLESRKILANKAEVRFCGFSEESEVLGKTDEELFEAGSSKETRADEMAILKTLKPIIDKEAISINRKNGKKTKLLVSKLPLVDEKGEAYGIVGICKDITATRQKEKELTDLINVTSEQNNKLINFAHIVSHNLRSHSANFSMLLDFLINEKNGDERKNIIKMLVTASDNLLETLENLNEVVRINTNTSIEKTPVILREAVIKVEQNLSAFLENNNARIINRISDKIIVPVIPAYLDSILMNCITNGIKYKEPSRDPIVELRAMKIKDYTVLSINDNGLGIDLDRYGDKLFGMYKTFHNNPDARGIGLYITKNQIEAMNGKVTVTSELGRGTTFNIYFNENN